MSQPSEPCDLILTQYAHLLDSTREIPYGFVMPPFFAVGLVSDLIRSARQCLATSKALVEVPMPTIIVGDLHGNISDLIRILRRFPSYATPDHILFLGDYVDRGPSSIDVIVLLLALTCKYPDRVFLLRGNHEFAHVNALYGFYDEVMTNYHSQELWSGFQDVFAHLPFAAVVGSRIFCVHGGLPRDLKSLEQIASTPMPVIDYLDNRMIADLVWSDPDSRVDMFADSRRGSGIIFGTGAVKKFLATADLKLMIRAHQCIADGFMPFAENCGLTLFSNSDYCPLQHNECGVTYARPDGTIELYSFRGDWNASERKTVMALRPDLGMRREFLRSGAACGRKREAMNAAVHPQLADRRQAIAAKRTPRNARQPPKEFMKPAERSAGENEPVVE
jgi:diadenosine tetraphosphatase ApaH/serine/threonine PP2A family protein phosphatase